MKIAAQILTRIGWAHYINRRANGWKTISGQFKMTHWRCDGALYSWKWKRGWRYEFRVLSFWSLLTRCYVKVWWENEEKHDHIYGWLIDGDLIWIAQLFQKAEENLVAKLGNEKRFGKTMQNTCWISKTRGEEYKYFDRNDDGNQQQKTAN